jgi:hypothetical protein
MPLSHVIAVVSITVLVSPGLAFALRGTCRWLKKTPPHLWRILAATLVVSAPNLWYVFAIVDLIQSHAPPGQTGWYIVMPLSALLYRVLLVKRFSTGVAVWFLQLPILILMAIVILSALKALGVAEPCF